MACSCAFKTAEAMPRSPSPRPKGATGYAGRKVGLHLDRSVLRTLLSSRAEVLEAMANGKAGPKATGRPTANVSVLWKYYTSSVYASGDLPAIATREALQNSVDAVRAALKGGHIAKGTGRFEVTWDGNARTLTFADNGVGMGTQDILDKFLSLGTSGKGGADSSDDAAGGFGVAKAVILGTSETFRWEMRTRNNRVVSHGADEDIEIFELSPPVQGTVLRIFDVSKPLARIRYDFVTKEYLSVGQRLKAVLGGCDLPDVGLHLNGKAIAPFFSRRRGSRLADKAPWGKGTTARIRGHRRGHGDKGGGYWVRLNGLYQFHQGSNRGNLSADIVIDLTSTIRPGRLGYPLNAARDGLLGDANALFFELRRETEQENESAGKNQEDEVLEPEGYGEEGAGETFINLAAEVLDDAELQRDLKAASGGLLDLLAARGAQTRQGKESQAPQSSRAIESVITGDVGAPGTPEVIRRFLLKADELRQSDSPSGESDVAIFNPAVDSILKRAKETGTLSPGGAHLVSAAVGRAMDVANGAGGGGIAQVADIPRVQAAVLALKGGTPADSTPKATEKKVGANPFGSLAGVRISKRYYDRRKAKRFIARWKASIPALVLWDTTLRMVAAEARLKRGFKPGWVLNDEVGALAEAKAGKTPIIYLHPDRLKEMAKAHKSRPMAVAGYLHGVACHELAHLDGRMGQGHDEEYVAAREELGRTTAHLLPAIAILATKLLKLKPPKGQEGTVIERLEGEVKRLKSLKHKGSVEVRERLALTEVTLKECKEALESARSQSKETRAALDGDTPCDCGCGGGCASKKPPSPTKKAPAKAPAISDWARKQLKTALEAKDTPGVVSALEIAFREAPPKGFEKDEISNFFHRKEGALWAMVDHVFGKEPIAYPNPREYPASMDTYNRQALYRAMWLDEAATLELIQAVEGSILDDWRFNRAAKGGMQEAIYNVVGDVSRTMGIYGFIRDETTY